MPSDFGWNAVQLDDAAPGFWVPIRRRISAAQRRKFCAEGAGERAAIQAAPAAGTGAGTLGVSAQTPAANGRATRVIYGENRGPLRLLPARGNRQTRGRLIAAPTVESQVGAGDAPACVSCQRLPCVWGAVSRSETEGLYWPEPAEGGPNRCKCAGASGLSASGGALFTAEKFRKRAGGCGPRTSMGLRGVHPKKRRRPGRYAPPSCPAPYCLPLPGFARASGIGQSLRLQNFSLRPHELPRNAGWMLHTAVFAHKYCRPHRRGGYQPPAWPRCLSALAERTRQQFNRRGAHCASVPRQQPLVAGAVVARGRLSRRAPVAARDCLRLATACWNRTPDTGGNTGRPYTPPHPAGLRPARARRRIGKFCDGFSSAWDG